MVQIDRDIHQWEMYSFAQVTTGKTGLLLKLSRDWQKCVITFKHDCMGPYIRVKRRHQTVFLDVQLTETFLSVKEKLGLLFQLPSTSIQLWQGLSQVGFNKKKRSG